MNKIFEHKINNKELIVSVLHNKDKAVCIEMSEPTKYSTHPNKLEFQIMFLFKDEARKLAKAILDEVGE